jgi:predicted AlkP superfamily phosphohydrolase/phosphomutase
LAGSPWPTFYTGTLPGDHGLYHYLQWRPDQMGYRRPDTDWLSARPFWRRLDGDRRVIALDVPMTFPPEAFHGVEISGWATHDHLGPTAAYPPATLEWVRREFGPVPLGEEIYGPQYIASLLHLRDVLLHATSRVAQLAEALMKREAWTLFLVGFGATHRGGHKLWDLSATLGEGRPGERDAFSRALRDVYASCDAAVGQLVEAAGDRVTVLVFSLHGMGPNLSRVDVLPAMLQRILVGDSKSTGISWRRGALQRLMRSISPEWRHWVKSRLPVAWHDRLTRFWQLGQVNWEATRAISLIADLQGYLRINVKGREAAGIVVPGTEYDHLCATIEEGLRSFVDADTGRPIVERVIRSDRLFPAAGRLGDLPDLLIRWDASPAAQHRAITSPHYGSIAWPCPGRLIDGRSGNHDPEGFVLATGPGVRTGMPIENAHILDLAPSVCSLLGVPTPAEMQGRVLPVVLLPES